MSWVDDSVGAVERGEPDDSRLQSRRFIPRCCRVRTSVHIIRRVSVGSPGIWTMNFLELVCRLPVTGVRYYLEPSGNRSVVVHGNVP